MNKEDLIVGNVYRVKHFFTIDNVDSIRINSGVVLEYLGRDITFDF